MTQDTKQVALAHLDRIAAGDIAGAAALMAEDCVNHAAVPEAQGRAGFVAVLTKLREAFPDLTYTLEDTIVEGDRAVLRVTFAGTQRGPLAFSRWPLPATGKAVTMEQIHIVRVTNGKIVEHWLGQDSFAMIRQLGHQIAPAT
jgi:steroid delta-isomerase-like uncharacterized protein